MTANDNAVRLFPVEGLTDGTASDDTTIIDLERAERGRLMYDHCDRWTHDNEDAARYVERAVLNAVRHGRRVSVREKLERVRWGDFTDLYGKPTRASNNLSAPLARRIIERHPETRPYIILRPSVCDEYDLLASGELS